LLHSPNIAQAPQIKVDNDPLNVIANRLEGDWQAIPDLNKKLGGGKDHPISFKSDSTAVKKLSEKMAKLLIDQRIYMAGYMTMTRKSYPFFLIIHQGNPTIVYLRPKDKDPYGDIESFLISFAFAQERENDVLFLGPESIAIPRSSCSAYERVKARGKTVDK
jgi:hypothetical protein